MKKYITLFLGYSILFNVFMVIGLQVLGAIAGFILIFIGMGAAALGVYLVDFSNITLSDMSIMSIIFNVGLIFVAYMVFYFVLKILVNWAFKGNIKQKYFTKESINTDIIFSTLFVGIIPVIFSILYFFEKNDYSILVFSTIYIVSFFMINKLKSKKEFNN